MDQATFLKKWGEAESIYFLARHNNSWGLREIAFEDGVGGELIMLVDALKMLRITPDMLRRVTEQYHTLPAMLADYDALGDFPIDFPPFLALAKILGKAIKVVFASGTEYGGPHLFTANPDGTIGRTINTPD